MKRALPLLLLAACSSPTWIREGYVAQIRPEDPAIPAGHADYGRIVQVQWLGVAGFHISLGGRAVLLPPLYSRHSAPGVMLAPLEVEAALIDRKLPPSQGVEAIFVGHAHYDHLLEVPYLLRKHAPRAVAYGSRTTVNILAGHGVPPERRIEPPLGTWVTLPSKRIRFAAFPSAHAPHVGRVLHAWTGHVERPMAKPARGAGEFLEGQPLSYLIEFLDGAGKPVFTIYYQDASAPGGVGCPTLEHRPIDVAILCVPSWKNVDGYPARTLARLRPRNVVLCHYDNFFRDFEKEMEFLFHDDTEEFLRETQRALREQKNPATIWMPYPQARMNFPLETR